MIRPDVIRLMAHHWRNVAQAATSSLEEMRAGGMPAEILIAAELTVVHARRTADALELRAQFVEMLGAGTETVASGGGN